MPNSLEPPHYPGDDALGDLLQADRSVYGVAGVRDLVRGVLGASPMIEATAWAKLVAPTPSEPLVAALKALKDRISQESIAASSIAERLARVRDQLQQDGLDGFIVPRTDEYQNEYVPACGERLAWLTGFTGSAGTAVILADRAAIFVDGRYTLQVRTETDTALFEPFNVGDDPPDAWLGHTLSTGQVVGYDPWLWTPSQIERLTKGVTKAGASLRPITADPVAAVWGTDRPAVPLGPVVPHPAEFAGQSASDKRAAIAARLAEEGNDALLVTAPDSLAWLLNIRGADVPHTPLPLGFAVLGRDGRLDLYMDSRKLTPGLGDHLGNEVAVWAPGDLEPALQKLAGRRVQLDPASAARWFFDRLGDAGAEIVRATDPITLAKATKNPVELAGSQTAHIRDGVALVRFLHWLDEHAPSGALTEIAVSDRLEAFRRQGDRFRDLSFPSISGAGPNGAIVHYRATEATERALEPDSLYLIDSGAQYLDGTTDVTRTVAIGAPSAEMKDRFTRVLKGHIAVATAIFPAGTTGAQLDTLARLPLWQVGLNYDHGTGHGVGSYLSVHEGPQRISSAGTAQALLPGMIVSNEPGYYKTGGYGIRIENLVLVAKAAVPGAERDMLHFETLTLCPIDCRAIDTALLSADEVAWLDQYHARVRDTLLPLIDEPGTQAWLRQATLPLEH